MSKLPYQGNIILKNKNHDLPEDVKLRATQKFKSVYGAAYASDGAIQTIVSSKEGLTLEELTTLCEALKDKAVAFYVGQYPDGFPAEVAQPYVFLTDAKENAVCVGYIEGAFMDYHDKDRPMHAHEFNFAQSMLIPELAELYMRSGNNIDKVFGELQNPRKMKQIEALCQPRGSILLLNNLGEVLTLGKNDRGLSMDWGMLSDSMGFKETSFMQTAATAVKSVVDKFTKPSKTIASTEPVKQAEAPKVVEQPKPTVAETAIASQMREAQAKLGDYTYKDKQVPVDLNEKNRKNWCKANTGHTLEGWKTAKAYRVFYNVEGKRVLVVDHRKLDTLDPKYRAASPADTATATAAAAAGTTLPKTKDIVPKHIPQPVQKVEDTVRTTSTEPEPVYLLVDPDERKDFIEKFMSRPKVKAAIDDGRQEIMHPKEIKSVEGDVPDFFAQHGMQGTEDILKWDGEMFNEVVQNYPNEAVSILLSLCESHRRVNYQLSQATAPAVQQQSTSVPATGQQQTRPTGSRFAPKVPVRKAG